MSDWPIDSLGGKTPLEVANKPNMDRLIKHGVFGLANTIPQECLQAAMLQTSLSLVLILKILYRTLSFRSSKHGNKAFAGGYCP